MASKNILIKQGDSGDAVRRVQIQVGAEPTGVFDYLTTEMAKIWQAEQRLTPDGLWGAKSWERGFHVARKKGRVVKLWPRVERVRLPLPGVEEYLKTKRSFDCVHLNPIPAAAFQRVIDEVQALGGFLTTSGSRRSIKARASKTRSRTSLHMVGRAVDLGVYSAGYPGGPIFITEEEGRRWRVWVHCPAAPEVEIIPVLIGVPRVKRSPIKVRAVDLTALLEEQGFTGIKSRRWAHPDPAADEWGATEWFHFQHEGGLEEGLTSWGDVLLQSHGVAAFRATSSKKAPRTWSYRHRAWGRGWK
jgi:hypothetical protein